MTPLRRTLVALAATGGLLLAGCGGKQQPQTAPTFSTEVTASAVPSTAPSSAAPSPTSGGGSGNGAPTYPSSAKSYAQALLSAWGAKNGTRIDQLAVQAAVQQIKDNGYPNSSWTYIKCDDDGTYATCLFRNAHGDESLVKMVKTQLGHPTAVTEAQLMRTSYANDAGSYVSGFVYAWQQGNKQRMIRYANEQVAAFFLSKTPPTSSMVTGEDNTAGHTKITMSFDGGTSSYTFNVVNQNLGDAHAIGGLCNPGCA
ncbi:hypothetical protein Cs7R123_64590 [Catellatospora sp. TT07R-123]|uniref:hypothetical protein n=1 Tax=Catellatospora sp. TT07R-123 TaxID=2733863 RepID=UPI001B0E4C86|nr:hypothetical protein [Catellatospora sp. TT07R-123]GHJ49117.1 hypothetical protein Cs7R123_64590 [Catellatospora sp. TT07R-123]